MYSFFGSSYVLDNNEMKRLLFDIKKSGASYIIDLHLGILSTSHMLIKKALPQFILHNNIIRKMLNKNTYKNNNLKFHGYNRNITELKKIYKELNIKVCKEFSSGCYKNSMVLKL